MEQKRRFSINHISCLLNRFIITGYRVNRYLVSDSVKAYNFREAQGLTVDEVCFCRVHFGKKADAVTQTAHYVLLFKNP